MVSYYFPGDDTQAKIHVNLPHSAWETLSEDMRDFSGITNAKGFSASVNHIVLNYIEAKRRPASIDTDIEKLQKELTEKLEADSQNAPALNRKTKCAVIDAVTSHVVQNQIDNIKKEFNPPKDIAHKIDLNHACREKLAEVSMLQNGEPPLICQAFGTAGLYVRAILLDYTGRPAAERCRIYHQEQYDYIMENIRKHRSIKAVFRDCEEPILLIPYGIESDAYQMHSYLVGIQDGKNSADEIILRRLSRIKSVSWDCEHKSLTPEQRKEIKEKIDRNGVGYLRDKSQDFKVRLTPAGAKSFKNITYQRPRPEPQTDEEKADNIYRFTCTKYQIKNYFRRFGADAVILEPKELHDEMLKEYQSAVKAYKA